MSRVEGGSHCVFYNTCSDCCLRAHDTRVDSFQKASGFQIFNNIWGSDALVTVLKPSPQMLMRLYDSPGSGILLGDRHVVTELADDCPLRLRLLQIERGLSNLVSDLRGKALQLKIPA